MKKLSFLFLVILFSASYSLHAQKQFSGEIIFESKIGGTADPILLATSENFTQTVTIIGDKSKAVMKPNEMVAVTQVWDGEKETNFVVIEITGMGKYYKKWTPAQMKEKLNLKDFNYSYEDDFKTICDYKCQKVVVTATNLEDNSQKEITLYVTKEIGTPKLNGDNFIGLKGYPLMAITPIDDYCEGCVQITEAVKITPKKIKDADFTLPDDAKNIDDNPELREMLKGAFGEE